MVKTGWCSAQDPCDGDDSNDRPAASSSLDYRLVLLQRKQLTDAFNDAWKEVLGHTKGPEFTLRYAKLPVAFALVDKRGLPVWAPTLFLASHSVRSRGVSSDTQRTYGESLIPWLRHLARARLSLSNANEETLQLYRAELIHAVNFQGQATATATANLRVDVAVQFHRWCQRHGFPSPLGDYLETRESTDRSLAPRIFNRHPRVLSYEEISRLKAVAERPYGLAFEWGLCAGMRRMEVCALRYSMLPRPEQLPYFTDGLASFNILRKGGRDLTVYVPVKLVEDTQWYYLTERIAPLPGYEDFIFIGNKRRPLTRPALSKEFRRCAKEIGSDATLHHLRHTYAINVLRLLNNSRTQDSGENNLKTLQVLMGHASTKSTEIYLRATEMTSPVVAEALSYLYGAKP